MANMDVVNQVCRCLQGMGRPNVTGRKDFWKFYTPHRHYLCDAICKYLMCTQKLTTIKL